MRYTAKIGAVTTLCHGVLFAQIQCAAPPQQAAKDSNIAVQTAVGKLGPIKAGEFSTNVKVTTQDLVSRLPKADIVYLEQMMFAAFCSSIRDNKSISDSEKSKALSDYAREVRRAISPSPSPSPSPAPAPIAVPVPVPVPKVGFSTLLNVFGLPQGSKVDWDSSYEMFEKLLPPSERVVSRIDQLAVEGRTTLADVPARTAFHFQNRKLAKVVVSVAADYSEWTSWVLREPPIPQRSVIEGNIELGKKLCSPQFIQVVESRASGRFSKVKDRTEREKTDPAYNRSSFGCNTYGCTSNAKVKTATFGFTHAEAPLIELESAIWHGVATYRTPKDGPHDGSKHDDWQCSVRLTFAPKSIGGI